MATTMTGTRTRVRTAGRETTAKAAGVKPLLNIQYSWMPGYTLPVFDHQTNANEIFAWAIGLAVRCRKLPGFQQSEVPSSVLRNIEQLGGN